MIALDTNVLVRFLVEDDPKQALRARSLIRRAIASSQTLFVSDIVLCELCWVLDRAYDLPRDQIVTALRSLLAANHLAFRCGSLLERALNAYQEGRGGFADYLIREQSAEVGCDSVATFDRALLKESGFTQV